MAEAHSAVAFSFTVGPEGVDINLNNEALLAVWHSGVLSWKKRMGSLKNDIVNTLFPSGPISLLFILILVLFLHIALHLDPSYGLINYMQENIIELYLPIGHLSQFYISCLFFALILWVLKIVLRKYLLQMLLTYQGWMFEAHGPSSVRTTIWMVLVKLIGGRNPLLKGYQGSLPKLPVPSVHDTVDRYLDSVRPILSPDKYKHTEEIAREFENTLGKKLQRYLVLKSWWASNYVSDWWEEYIYLRGRSPIMVNSNFYGLDTILYMGTHVQVARAANMVYSTMMFRRLLETETLKPLMVNKAVPLCSAQYDRIFSTTRIPGKDLDKIVHLNSSNHIVVYHQGRYFRVNLRYQNRYLKPCELEVIFQHILDDKSEPNPGEKHLAALTAGPRPIWAEARERYFSKGKNRLSLRSIEKAAFFLVFDEEPYVYNPENPDDYNRYGRAMLHGKCYDRWFDKSFNICVGSNGRVGFNSEHSWADAPILAHMSEYVLFSDRSELGYDENGHTLGVPEIIPPSPIRLEWDLSIECQKTIEKSLTIAQELMNDVDLILLLFEDYGKGFMKKCKVSPDAYIQQALQLTYNRDAGKFCLTYESAMTRLFREGRTETVRSCSMESVAFVTAMNDPDIPKEEKKALFYKAVEKHVFLYRQAMTGNGIDRHLFCLYVVSQFMGEESQFLNEVLAEPWRLSTSQTPLQQTDKLDLVKNPEYISGGGGFGPVADDGYGVAYMISGENRISFHISSKKSCEFTSSKRFAATLKKSFADMKDLFE